MIVIELSGVNSSSKPYRGGANCTPEIEGYSLDIILVYLQQQFGQLHRYLKYGKDTQTNKSKMRHQKYIQLYHQVLVIKFWSAILL